MVQAAAIFGLLLGLLFKGRLKNIANHEIRWIPVLIISFLLEAYVFSGLLFRMFGNTFIYNELRLTAALFQYILVIFFLIKNILNSDGFYPGAALSLIAAGSLANGLAIIFNGGMMPIAQTLWRLGPSALQKIEQSHHYIAADSQTRLLVLSDWIPVWSLGWYMVSPGDFLIAAGLFIFCFRLTKNYKYQKTKTVEHHDEIVYTNGR